MTIATGVVIYWIAIDLVRYLLLGAVVAVIYLHEAQGVSRKSTKNL